MLIDICNLKHEKPHYPFEVKVCRGVSILGNPFPLNHESERDEVCDKYEKWFNQNLETLQPALRRLLSIYDKYERLRLFCFCAPKRCHAETIKKWLEDNYNK
jgi:hypothetical protein